MTSTHAMSNIQAEDVYGRSLSLQIPAEVLNPGGLISLGMKGMLAAGMTNIPQYNLAVVLTTIANAIGGKMTAQGIHPNVFNIKVGRSFTGKSSSDRAVVRALMDEDVYGFYGATDFASGPALMRSLVNQPVQMIVIDECTSMFKRYDKGDSVSDGKRDALMEIYSASGQRLHKVYDKIKHPIIVECPCLTLTGNAKDEIFNAIQEEDFNTGTMQRFDFWMYDGPTPERRILKKVANEELILFAKGVKAIFGAIRLNGMNLDDNSNELGLTERATETAQAWLYDVTSRGNAADSDGYTAMIKRQFDLAIKYAMIHSAGTRPVEAIFQPLDVQDIEYGIKVAKMLVEWKISTLRSKVPNEDLHNMCEIFKAAIAGVLKVNQRPTLKTMVNRRPAMKNWKKKDTDEVIFILQKRGEIVIDDRKKPTAYQLAK